MLPETIKNKIVVLEHVTSVYINGNEVYSFPFNKSIRLMDDHKVFLNDDEFVQKYFPDLVEEDEDHDYELRVEESYYITTNDGGEVYIDFGSIMNDHGDYEDLGIVEDSQEAKIVHDWLISKDTKWDTDMLNELVTE